MEKLILLIIGFILFGGIIIITLHTIRIYRHKVPKAILFWFASIVAIALIILGMEMYHTYQF